MSLLDLSRLRDFVFVRAHGTSRFQRTIDEVACDAIRGNVTDSVFAAILTAGVNIHAYALVDLALNSHPKFMNKLLAAGLPLVFSARSVDMVRLLLAHGAKPNTIYQQTPLLTLWCAGQFSSGSSINTELEVISELLKAGADVNARDYRGSSALHAAFGNRRSSTFSIDAMIQTLLAAGARIDVADNDGVTPLMVALAKREPTEALLRTLVQAGAPATANLRFRANGFTFCHMAASLGDRDLMALLINERGADVNAATHLGQTPLMVAVEHRHADIVSMLIAAGAKVDVARDGATALHIALRADIADALINAGADVNAADLYGWTPGHYAAALGDLDLVVRLLAAGGDVNSASAVGDTLLHVAALAAVSDNVIRALVDAGGNLDATNHSGQTPCHVAVKSANVLRTLIELGANLDQLDGLQRSPLLCAVTGKFERSIELLLVAGASVAVIDAAGASMLHRCMQDFEGVSPKIVRMLVARGIDINARDANGASACDIAIKRLRRVDCVRALVALGAQLPEPEQPFFGVEMHAFFVAAGVHLGTDTIF